MCFFHRLLNKLKCYLIKNFITEQEKDQNSKCKPDRSIVVTGFAPYFNIDPNPSWEAVKILKDLWDKDTKKDTVKLITERIPVSYDFVQKYVPNKWKYADDQCNVIAMIHVGAMPGPGPIALEEQAFSDKYFITDVNGKFPPNGRCISNQSRNGKSGPSEEGEHICMTSFFEVDDLVDHLNNTMGDGIAKKSCNAGRFLCEFVYFKSLYAMDRRALFIHVPPMKDIPAEKCAQAIKKVIEYIIQNYPC